MLRSLLRLGARIGACAQLRALPPAVRSKLAHRPANGRRVRGGRDRAEHSPAICRDHALGSWLGSICALWRPCRTSTTSRTQHACAPRRCSSRARPERIPACEIMIVERRVLRQRTAQVEQTDLLAQVSPAPDNRPGVWLACKASFAIYAQHFCTIIATTNQAFHHQSAVTASTH